MSGLPCLGYFVVFFSRAASIKQFSHLVPPSTFNLCIQAPGFPSATLKFNSHDSIGSPSFHLTS